ncbi:MAG: histidinol-phosphatase HisJ family protein, partial [Aggregatilineales bacterium]
MIERIDYHVHTDNSFDCKTPMDVMCRRAVALGVTEIAFTDHFNNHLLDVDLGYYEADRYFANLAQCRAQYRSLTIRSGIELGEPHRWRHKIEPILSRYSYDVILGSLHRVGNESVFDPNYFRRRSPEQAYNGYFAELTAMIRYGGFNILAHVDLPKRVGFEVYGRFDVGAFEEGFRSVWQACLDTGIVPELNTKGLRCPVAQLHPTVEALRWYADMGGQAIVFGSDAHSADNVADHF